MSDPPAVPSEASQPGTILRTAYRPPAFLVDTVELRIELDAVLTRVHARLALRRNPAPDAPPEPLRLDGEGLRLRALRLDGTPLDPAQYHLPEAGGLVIAAMPAAGVLEIETEIAPEANTAFVGLYRSGGVFVTQCEPEGFRRITFFPDRPDVLARYSVTLVGDRLSTPMLIANGNLVDFGRDGRQHWARWVDPHPKPSYLFALLAGDMVAVRDRFTTRGGRVVDLAVRVHRGEEAACHHAMAALKAVMAWEEAEYGFEYDLDALIMAGVPGFNAGGQENKGLFLFNTQNLLATPQTASDADHLRVTALVAHEYLHNWTGNRVTVRDWFQLTVKEALTTFREQQFMQATTSAALRRIEQVSSLRAGQFRSDAGPLAHPARPESYRAVANVYTSTVYRKGAEILRMLHLVLGGEPFRRGIVLFAERHDGQAVTLEALIGALEAASGRSLAGFLAWFGQAGTPALATTEHHDAPARRFTLTLRQHTAATPGQPDKQPLPIPVATALFAPDGQLLAERLLLLEQAEQRFVFEDIAAPPVVSLLRGFSAPVTQAGRSQTRLRFLAAHDTDPVARWDALQAYVLGVLGDRIARRDATGIDQGLAAAMRATLAAAADDPAYAAICLRLPDEDTLAEGTAPIDVETIFAVREGQRSALGTALHAEFAATHAQLSNATPYIADGPGIGRRALRNACLGYLAAAGAEGMALAIQQATTADNLTDALVALSIVADSDTPQRPAALARFHAQWRDNALVLDRWFSIQAFSTRPDTLAVVRSLASHPDFDPRSPNRARALFEAFAGNQLHFHNASGAGYQLIAEAIAQLDPINPTTAARLVDPLGAWRRHTPQRATAMRAALATILAIPGVSPATAERATRALGGG